MEIINALLILRRGWINKRSKLILEIIPVDLLQWFKIIKSDCHISTRGKGLLASALFLLELITFRRPNISRVYSRSELGDGTWPAYFDIHRTQFAAMSHVHVFLSYCGSTTLVCHKILLVSRNGGTNTT